jgi:hypothetical protein
MHLKVSILETEKNPRNSLFWANIYKKNQKTKKKKPKKILKTQKNPKNPLGWVFK